VPEHRRSREILKATAANELELFGHRERQLGTRKQAKSNKQTNPAGKTSVILNFPTKRPPTLKLFFQLASSKTFLLNFK